MHFMSAKPRVELLNAFHKFTWPATCLQPALLQITCAPRYAGAASTYMYRKGRRVTAQSCSGEKFQLAAPFLVGPVVLT